MFQSTRAEIHLSALKHNWSLLKNHQQDEFLCPMIKAKAYGHDDILVAQKLQQWGCQNLGVCLIDEGLRLRQAGIKKEIIVFRSFDQQGFQACIENKLTPVINGWDQIDILKKYNGDSKSKLAVHLKFDTGMQRLGFSSADAEKLSDFFNDHRQFRVQGLLTHLACSDESLTHPEITHLQLQDLEKAALFFKKMNPIVHALNSGGVLSQMQWKKDPGHFKGSELLKKKWGARPGIMLYGFNPGLPVDPVVLKPVMKLVSHPVALKKVKKGQGVSYGHTWKAEKDSVIAVIPMGYADGYPRNLSGKGKAVYNDQLVSLVGRVCMDYLMLDVTDVEKNPDRLDFEKINVVMWGDEKLSVDQVAQTAGTISYEIVTRVSDRVPKVAVEGSVL